MQNKVIRFMGKGYPIYVTRTVYETGKRKKKAAPKNTLSDAIVSDMISVYKSLKKKKLRRVVRVPTVAQPSALKSQPLLPMPDHADFKISEGSSLTALDKKIVDTFPGKIVRKDLTAQLKRGANVPTYVLEYLLGMYCATDDESIIRAGTDKIRQILSENYVRPDESERIKSLVRERGEYTIIDKISARLDEKEDKYIARFMNLEISDFEISSDFVTNNEKLLMGGVWCIVRLAYSYNDDDEELDPFTNKPRRKRKSKYASPFRIISMKPIQMPSLDIHEMIDARKDFSKDDWIFMLLRSEGYEPEELSQKQRMHYLERLVPLIQKNYNLVELGPRGTGKSHVYQELSPYSILMSGGKTTVSNLFFNMSTRHVGLVGHWDCIAFDEVAGMDLRDMDAVQILKNYMANGSFARGQNAINADASLCFEGNINDSVENMLKTTHLFNPFPEQFHNDSAFFDRIHYYIPGWETPKLRSEMLTERYGLITDCMSEFCREMRPYDFTHLFDRYFMLNGDFNKRDDIAVRKTFSGLAKLIYPDGVLSKEDVRELLEYAIEGRRRVKEQLKLMAGVEFIDTNLGYIDIDTNEETIVYVPEQSANTLVPEQKLPAGHVFAVGKSVYNGEVAIYRLENKTIAGSGKMETQGMPGHLKSVRECVTAAFIYFGENARKVVPGFNHNLRDYLLYYADPQEKGASDEISLAEFIGLCSALADRAVMESMVIVGEIKISGTMMPLTSVTDIIRVCVNAGARSIMLPMDSIGDIQQVPKELLCKINPVFYYDPIDAAKKALNLF